MLPNANTVPKLYLSVIEDVLESVRELFQDEGVEERVLEHLRQLWESKVVQSKAVEGFIKDNNPSKFVLQLPANYTQSLHKPTVVIPAAANVQNFTSKSSCGSVATFSLPPGISYPVQIPAGVTLQTASGHLYKVNVPVMVTRGAQHVLTRPAQAPVTVPQPPARLPDPAAPACLPNTTASAHLPDPAARLPDPAPPAPQTPLDSSASPGEFTLDGIEFSPQPVDASGFTPAQHCGYSSFLKERDADPPDLQNNTSPGRQLSFSPLLEIPQLDGAADSSDSLEDEEEDEEELGLVGEKEFLGMISANEEEELEEEEDPLNSGDDVSEQDIPEIFDTENVIVCQYDKIHRSKNRWKFYLKDGVMCYGGKDYVFSKAVGEAEW
ncbi:TFIIA-alpha and beta-like factor [Danio aesculapii]|uniref:TFIIA-alpha and beta-like factor n=1 Tax=Danio aesculapii TaxID=1142201 RepID=UPI0024C06ECB|nr:TFIIA-alpha and beta-like factor [Danio aesculapii]